MKVEIRSVYNENVTLCSVSVQIQYKQVASFLSIDFLGLILINSPLQLLWQNRSETVFGAKHNHESKTITADKTKYLIIIKKFDVIYSKAMFFKETYL